VAPFWVRNVYQDRGHALERAWMINAKRSQHPDGKSGKDSLLGNLDQATLNGWQEDVRLGVRPAVIFNATSVETGQRLAFATAPYNSETILRKNQLNASPPIGLIDFSTSYHRANILISTAARLLRPSPTFHPLRAPYRQMRWVRKLNKVRKTIGSSKPMIRAVCTWWMEDITKIRASAHWWPG
jgi:hypothetical protein